MSKPSNPGRVFTWVVGVAFLLLIVSVVFAPRPVDWSYSFSHKDEIPFGTYLVHEALPSLFPEQELKTCWVSPDLYQEGENDESVNFIFINGRISLEEKDALALLNSVEKGNHVFIAAEHVFGPLADTLKLDYKPDLKPGNAFYRADSVGFHFANKKLRNGNGHWYPQWMTRFYFAEYDSLRTTVLGHDHKGDTNFIRVKHGNGSFYFNSNPLAFTNYHLLSRNNSEYIFKALSYLPVQTTVWDEYYKPRSTHHEGLFDYVLHNTSLQLAWYVLLFGILVLLVLGSRRKQRPVSVWKKPVNTSLSFVDTMARLYYSKGDHLDIARKRYTYFLEFLRSRYYINISSDRSRLISDVAKKADISERSVAALFKMGDKLNKVNYISGEDLEQFNRQVEFFYNNCR